MKMFKALLLAAALFATPALADECKLTEMAMTELATQKSLKVEQLSKADIAILNDKLGPPPVEAFTGIDLLSNAEMGQLQVINNGCVILSSTAYPIELFNHLLGRTSAGN